MQKEFQRNLLAVYSRATDTDLVAGKLWYRTARETAFNLALDYKVLDSEGNPDFKRVCGIIAALSPQQSWKVNVENAATCLRTRKFRGHTKDNVRKARRIFEGKDPLSVLGGHKVRAFYQNLVSGGTEGAPCIDRHALSVCLGREATEMDQRHLGNRVSLQRATANAYKVAAILKGIRVGELQAITWVTWRREKGITD